MFCVVQNRFTVFVSCITWQQTWLGTFQGTLSMNICTEEERKRTQRGKETSKYTETITQVNITSLLEFHLARVKLCSYLQLTGRLQNSRFYPQNQ